MNYQEWDVHPKKEGVNRGAEMQANDIPALYKVYSMDGRLITQGTINFAETQQPLTLHNLSISSALYILELTIGEQTQKKVFLH